MKNKHVTWLVIFDANTCRIYDYNQNQMILIKEIQHPENKLRDIDITSDKPGRYQSGEHAHGTFSQESDPKEIKIENFSREISSVLEHGRNTHAYGKLILAASPHIHGLLLKHINKHVENLITHHIEKDLIHLTENNLLVYLNEALKHH